MEQIIKRIKELAESGRLSVIGIDGLGGAGKSTLSEKLAEKLNAEGYQTILLHIDDFIHERAVRYSDACPEWECYYDLQWRYGHFREVTEKLRRGESAETVLYDKENDSFFTENVTPSDNAVVLTEGIFLQRPELDGVFDLMIYIDVSQEERLARALRRDTYIGGEDEIERKYRVRYFPAEEHYVRECRPAERADIVIKGE